MDKKCDCGHRGPDVRRTGSGNECAKCRGMREQRDAENDFKAGVGRATNEELGLPKFAGRGSASHRRYEEEVGAVVREPGWRPGWCWPQYAKGIGL